MRGENDYQPMTSGSTAPGESFSRAEQAAACKTTTTARSDQEENAQSSDHKAISGAICNAAKKPGPQEVEIY
jgi:hypothetical protein